MADLSPRYRLRREALAAAERQRAWRAAERGLVNAALGRTLDEAAVLKAAEALRTAFAAEEHGRHSHDHPAPPKPCSRCGRNIVYNDWGDEEGESFTVGFGYGSRFDLECWHLTLCDDCFTTLADLVESGQGPGVMRFDYLERRWLEGTVRAQVATSPPVESCLEPLPQEATGPTPERVSEPTVTQGVDGAIPLR